MKTTIRNQGWKVWVLLALVAAVFRLTLSLPAYVFSGFTGHAIVFVNNVKWTDDTTFDATTVIPPKIAVECGSAIAHGWAKIDNECTTEETQSLDIDDGGTECKIDEFTDASGNMSYRIYDAKQPGTITVTVSVEGKEKDDNDECTVDIEKSVTGTLEVVEDCACGSNPSFGTPEYNNNSLDFRLHLGRGSSQLDAGFLWLKADQGDPTLDLASRSLLRLPYERLSTLVEVLRDGNDNIDQIKVPQGLLDFVSVSASGYTIKAYYDNQVNPLGAGSRYTIRTGETPFAVWVLLRDSSPSVGDEAVSITETRDGEVRTHTYTFTGTNRRWDLLRPDENTDSTVSGKQTASVARRDYRCEGFQR